MDFLEENVDIDALLIKNSDWELVVGLRSSAASFSQWNAIHQVSVLKRFLTEEKGKSRAIVQTAPGLQDKSDVSDLQGSLRSALVCKRAMKWGTKAAALR